MFNFEHMCFGTAKSFQKKNPNAYFKIRLARGNFFLFSFLSISILFVIKNLAFISNVLTRENKAGLWRKTRCEKKRRSFFRIKMYIENNVQLAAIQ